MSNKYGFGTDNFPPEVLAQFALDARDASSFDYNTLNEAKIVKKMPVSYLQEICGRRKVGDHQVVPVYDLRAAEGQVHEPLFVYFVTADDMTGSGRGKNKKIAKHRAAQDLLMRIVENDCFVEWGLPGETSEDAMTHLKETLADIDSLPGADLTTDNVTQDLGDDITIEGNGDGDNRIEVNAISKLHEIHAQRHWPMPEYDFVSETGMPHEKTFVVKVTVGRFEKTGTARAKKVAKRLAAEAMLKFLNEMPLEERDKDLVIEHDEEEAPEPEDAESDLNAAPPSGDLAKELESVFLDQKEVVQDPDTGKPLFTFNMDTFSQTSAPMRPATVASLPEENPSVSIEEPCTVKSTSSDSCNAEKLKLIEELDRVDPEAEPMPAHQKLFKKICAFTAWKYDYSHLVRQSTEGKYQCIASYYVEPPIRAFGVGNTKDEAEWDSSLKGLEFMKMFHPSLEESNSNSDEQITKSR